MLLFLFRFFFLFAKLSSNTFFCIFLLYAPRNNNKKKTCKNFFFFSAKCVMYISISLFVSILHLTSFFFSFILSLILHFQSEYLLSQALLNFSVLTFFLFFLNKQWISPEMLRRSVLLSREPMIKFRYAIAKNGGKPFQWVVAAAGGSTSSLLESFDDLPPHFRPRLMSEEEMEIVMMGGAKPYEMKKKKSA